MRATSENDFQEKTLDGKTMNLKNKEEDFAEIQKWEKWEWKLNVTSKEKVVKVVMTLKCEI